ncbi:MAG: T9SS type A sorting domain-containing protein [Bacteroidota bacterium]|nr:T9SS type A sorting domain-containing protein [Bacteroidota bacterium]
MKILRTVFIACVLGCIVGASQAQVTKSLSLKITDAGGIGDSLIFGEDGRATDGLDASLGEYELPPIPPSGAFDVRWIVPGVEGLSIDYRDTLSVSSKRNFWTGNFQPSAAGYPMTISWNSTQLWSGFFYIYDGETNGTKFSYDMSTRSSVTITDQTIKSIKVVHVFTAQKTVSVVSGWNLLSIPVEVKQWDFNSLFPTASSFAYTYNGGYVQKDTLQRQIGYWVKFSSPTQVSFTGEPFQQDTFSVNSGWNLIGSIVDSVDVSAIQQMPAGILNSYFFSYQNSYKVVNSLLPGNGHWVKANATGKIILKSAVLHKRASIAAQASSFEQWNTLSVSDVNGKEATIYFKSTLADVSQCELPPKPPTSVMDVRFSTGKFAEAFTSDNAEREIEIQGMSFPITLAWNIKDESEYKLSADTKKLCTLSNNGEVQLNETTKDFGIKLLNRITFNVPVNFSLAQNFPNPFNPSTMISYQLPMNSLVTLKIYDMLGREAATLVNKKQNAGYYQAEWSPNVSSEIYFYRIEATSLDDPNKHFVEVKKMILMR